MIDRIKILIYFSFLFYWIFISNFCNIFSIFSLFFFFIFIQFYIYSLVTLVTTGSKSHWKCFSKFFIQLFHFHCYFITRFSNSIENKEKKIPIYIYIYSKKFNVVSIKYIYISKSFRMDDWKRWHHFKIYWLYYCITLYTLSPIILSKNEEN